ncbi:hypothetical protein PAMA_007882 [Pampus argenteus]
MRFLVFAFLGVAAFHSDQMEFEAAQKGEAIHINGGGRDSDVTACEESQSESSEEAEGEQVTLYTKILAFSFFVIHQ